MKKRRLELGLTQEQLCNGICEPVTISRLENGKQTPSRRNLNALLGRLSMPTDRYYALLSNREKEVERIWHLITSYNVKFTQASAENRNQIRNDCLALHAQLRKIADDHDVLIQQHLLRSVLLLGKDDGPYSFEEQVELLQSAIHLTLPNFNLHEIYSGLYSIDEIKLINQLATVYMTSGHHWEAIEILSQLYRYIKQNFSNATLTRAAVGMVAYNYANELYTIEQYQRAIDLIKEAIDLVINCASTQALPELVGLSAECYHFLGDDQKSLELFYESFYLMKVLKKDRNCKNLVEDAKKLLGIDISLPPLQYQKSDLD